MRYPHAAARIFNTPLLIHPQKLDAILAGLGTRLLGGKISFEPAEIEGDRIAPEMFSTRRGDRVKEAGWPGYSVVDGVAVVPASGALVHRTTFDMNTSELLQGYNDLALANEHAMSNSDVHAVLQVWDSPGGEAQGAFEYAQRMFALRGKKPMYAIADGLMASAAFLGGSAADQVAVTNTGYAGSIGVVMRHVDFSRAVANEGIAVTYIFAGAHKVDGNPFEPLPAAVRADFQAEINTLYDMFVAAVASQMKLDPKAVRGTEARTFMGEAAVKAGLAHRVATTDQLISELAALRAPSVPVGQSARSSTAHDKGDSMSGTQPAADGQQSATTLTQADVDKASAAATNAERARASSILTHKEAEGRTALAIQCVTSGLTVEAAGALMAAAPKAAATSPFGTVMSTLNPDVHGDGGKGAEDEGMTSQQVAASWDRAFGIEAKPAKH